MLLLLFGCQTSDKNSSKVASEKEVIKDTLKTISTGVKPDKSKDNAISFLREYYKKDIASGLLDSTSRRFMLAEQDLNDDGKNEIFLGLSGSYFCGSGGCTVLLLSSEQKLNTSFTVVNYPIFIAQSTTHQWKDLLIKSNGKLHIIKFTGVKYPANPSVQPTVDSLSGIERKILEQSASASLFRF